MMGRLSLGHKAATRAFTIGFSVVEAGATGADGPGRGGAEYGREMEYKKSMQDVKKALDSVKQSGGSPSVTAQSPGVRANRALKRLEKVASS
jgi:hypothetical protein